MRDATRGLGAGTRCAGRVRKWPLAALLAALTAATLAQAPPAQTAPILFENVAVFDGEELHAPTNVLVEGGVITALGEGTVAPEGAEVIDGSGMTLMPGLIDAHVHAFTAEALQQALMFGVTTVLDMFTDEAFAQAMREEQAAEGAPARADLYSAGALATAPGGHGTQFGLDIETLESPEDAGPWVAGRVAAGADYVKAVIETGAEMNLDYATLDAETLRAVVEAAHAAGLLVVTHVQTLEAARTALEAGTDGFAHVFSDAVPDAGFVQELVEAGAFVIATLSVFQSVGANDPIDSTLAEDERFAPYLAPLDLQSLGSPFHGFEALSVDNARGAVRLLHEAGVPILAGTDAPNPGTALGASMHRELELLVGSGLTPTEALAAATSVTAETFGLTDRGRIATGMVADLLLVSGDPTSDILATRDIAGVWKRGVRADRAGYAERIAEAVEAAAAAVEALQGEGPVPISDFEDQSFGVSFGFAWQPTTDEQAGGDSSAELEVVEGGADGTAGALRVNGSIGTAFQFPWGGAMFMPGAVPFGPLDLSSKPTLAFWARGDGGTYRVQLFCANTGQTPPQETFQTTDEWQSFEFDLGSIGDCDTSAVSAIILSAADTGPYEFFVDEVELR